MTVVAAATAADVAAAATAGEVTAGSVAWARDLVNTPPPRKDPAWLAGQARLRLAALPHVTVTVLGPDELRAGGFGGVLAVGGGSACRPASSWRPTAAVDRVRTPGAGRQGHHLHTGGLSIKTTAGCGTWPPTWPGAPAVLAAVDAAARLGLPGAVSAVVPAAENAVWGAAYRPADVVRHVGGRTTEVRNTDAEGRLVLADGLAHSRLQLGATVLVDVATLTGAMKQALGARTAGLYATSDGLADALCAAGAAAGEALWRLPLAQEYGHLLEAPSPTPTTRPATRAARRRRCSCGPSPAGCRGRTWTSPGRPGPGPTTATRSRAAPASAPAPCCAGSRPAPRWKADPVETER